MQRRALLSFPGWIIFVVVVVIVIVVVFVFFVIVDVVIVVFIVVVVIVVVVANRPIEMISRRQPGSSSGNGLLLWQVL